MTVIVSTPDELHAKRVRLLAEVGMIWDELAERANGYSLTVAEYNVYETIRGIRYLLREE